MKFSLTSWLLTAAALNLNYISANKALRGISEQVSQNIHHRVLEQEETGTYLVAEIEYSEEGPSNSKPEQTVNIELGNGLIYQLTNVNPSWTNGNRKSLESGKSKIKIGKGATIAGDKIDLHGKTPEEVKGLFDRNLEQDNHRKLATTTGTKTVLAVRVIASDGEYGFSESALSDEVFGTYGDPVNLVSQYKACSFDQLNFGPAEHPQINEGVVTITVATSTTEGDGVMRNAITSAINAQFGVTNPNQLANHVMYCLPPGTMSGIAYAYINSWNSVYSNQWCNYVSGQMHEIGHNLNFAHSNEAGSYKDQTGMMGYSYSSDDGPIMCFNAAKSYQTGWYQTKVVSPTSGNCGGFDGKVYGLSDYENTGRQGVTVVKIDVAGGPDFFVNYNKATGVNSGTREGADTVTIASAGSEGTGYAESELLAKLNPGSSFTISNFGGTGKDAIVLFEALDTSVSPNPARVIISYDGMVCGSSTSAPVTPPPSKSPITASPTKMPVTSAPTTASPTKMPVTSAPTTASPTKMPVTSAPSTLNPTKAPVTASPTTPNPTFSPTVPLPTKNPTAAPTPCWEKYTQCDPNGVHFCCNGCQANGRWAGTCK